jgi:hypothetical protein
VINFLVSLLVLVIIAVVVFYVTKYILDAAEADPPIRKIVLLILLVVFLVAVLNLATGGIIWKQPVLVTSTTPAPTSPENGGESR